LRIGRVASPPPRARVRVRPPPRARVRVRPARRAARLFRSRVRAVLWGRNTVRVGVRVGVGGRVRVGWRWG